MPVDCDRSTERVYQLVRPECRTVTEGIIMGAAEGTVTVTPEVFHGRRMMAAVKAGDMVEAVKLAREGAKKFPAFRIPAANGHRPSFAEIAAKLSGELGTAAPAPVVKKAKSGKKAAKKAIAAIAAAPAEPRTVTLRLVHRVGTPTSLFGVEKDSPAHLIIGSARKGGLGWIWYGQTEAFYIRGSGAFAARMDKIGEAVTALEGYAGPEPVRYKVDVVVDNIDPKTGVEAPAFETAAQRRQREKAAAPVPAPVVKKTTAPAPAPVAEFDLSDLIMPETPAPAPAPAPVPSRAQSTMVEAPAESLVGKTWVFKAADKGASKTKIREVATSLRSDLANRVAKLYPGMAFQVRADREARTLTVILMAAPADVSANKLSVQVRGTALTVVGIAA